MTPALPCTPGVASDAGQVTNNRWQNTRNQPDLTWVAPADLGCGGIAGYRVYWGSNSAGTVTTTPITRTTYRPPVVADPSVSYLRLQAVDRTGNASDWTTSFVYRYDAKTPGAPGRAVELNGAANNIWQRKVNAPEFAWPAATDIGSGIAGYNIYWGIDPTGEATRFSATAGFVPVTVTLPSTYYLRARSRDNAGNNGVWTTIFTFRYDATPPGNPTAVMEAGGVTNNRWQNRVSDPNFTWTAASDAASGLSGYRVYWGPDPAGTATRWLGVSAFDPPAVTSPSVNYLRLQPWDKAGNAGNWITAFTFRFDIDRPGLPSGAVETHGVADGVWQNAVRAPSLTWLPVTDAGSGTAGYRVYWGPTVDGTSAAWRPTAVFTPTALTTAGTFFLRAQAVDAAANAGDWMTLFTFRYDATPPAQPSLVQEQGGAQSGVCQRTVVDPRFTWPVVNDLHSGLSGYRVYWGSDPAGACADTTVDPAFDPPALSGSATLHLRLQSFDAVGNASACVTRFTFCYDGDSPSAPTNATEDGGAPNGVWQKAVARPRFRWQPAPKPGSDLAGYYVYWGADPAGIGATRVVTATYVPTTTVTTGAYAYYLRAQAVDRTGNRGPWTDLFTFLFDNTPPPLPTDVHETGGAPNDVWQNTISVPAFAWSQVNDLGSGITNYRFYWGTSASGTTTPWVAATTSYDPPPLASPGVYYLRMQTQDAVGSTSPWATVFTFRYDGIAPGVARNAVEGSSAPNGIWQNAWADPNFTWTAASDAGGSQIERYAVYWGPDPLAITPTLWVTTTAFNPPLVLNPSANYLRVQALDKAGNPGPWAAPVRLPV